MPLRSMMARYFAILTWEKGGPVNCHVIERNPPLREKI